MNNVNNTLNNLIWIDLEMTGLNPDQDYILEIAIVITDQKLNIIADNFDVIIYQPPKILNLMNNVVRELHTKNGLLNLIPNSSISTAMAEAKALEFVKQYVSINTSPMCGNTICQDRRFLFKHMPQLEKYFHYRNLDVSTIKILGFSWFNSIMANLNKSDSTHRAKDDILQSIEELKFYKKHLFIPND